MRASARGFTLFEVLAAVLILGLFYTVLADRAIRGLRSEGMDRRRSEAAALADARLVDLETAIASGAPLQPLSEETEEGDFRVLLDVQPEDLDALLPPPPVSEPERGETQPRLLMDESGQSRIYRLQVVVSWEEAGEAQQLQRTSWDFDRSQLALLFPTEDGGGEGTDTAGRDGGSGSEPGSEPGSGGRPPSGGSGGGREDVCDNVQSIEDMMRCMQQVQRK